MVDSRLLEILACPACASHPSVRLENDSLVCDLCKRAYPITDGIPVMLVEESTIKE